MIVIGVDEAGYGPLLGPLVVAGAAFRVAPGRDAAPGRQPRGGDVLSALEPAVAGPGTSRAKRAGRLVVGDSKQVFGPRHDPAPLELAVLSFLAARDGDPPRSLDQLLDAVAEGGAACRSAPWYGGGDVALPRWADAALVAPHAGRLREAFQASGVSFEGFAARVLPEEPLNDAFRRTGNKADVLFDASAGVFERLSARRGEGQGVRCTFDRQGGRRFYLPPMMARWPGRFAWAEAESPTSSRYVLPLGDAEARVRFDVDADRDAMETGLASMCAKYLRETFMDLWNAWFAARIPGVPGTAGYATDGRRWLDATREPRAALGIPDGALERVR